ncbi:hypothetical protein BCR39DRAFT_547659 [Naematelia encephala]|uniref:Alpha/beta hydrolase fold-3 domain-containing protein n=1 Tax=Naematelia encephala TaxID=71784 RepID=A0A1Y2AP92_9TREE|nr:hypothetical protein BCR39DRAFT_547659 [Naematelia encephala]
MASLTMPAPPASSIHSKHPLRQLLDPYTASNPLRSPSPLPPSSRQDPKLQQRLPPAASNPLLWSLPSWIMFLRFALAKGIHIIWSLVKHFLWGPVRRSWGYRMTFITSFMRNVADHTSLADIVLIRRLISLHQIIPLPSDAIVTPITFIVPKRQGDKVARGFLRELDEKETGSRELSGEWVVGTEVWKRLKAERRARREAERRRRRHVSGTSQHSPSLSNPFDQTRGGLRDESMGGGDTPEIDEDAESIASGSRRSTSGERVIYYVHGGAYYVGNAATHRLITIGVSKACNARVFAITYRLAPEHVFPLPLHDVLHGYLRLLAPPLSIPPENIVIAGDSAGGGLSLALCMYLRDEGYKLPAGLVLMSPWVDLTMSCGSWDENAESDVVPRPTADDHLNPVACYLGAKGIATYLTHPYASPLFGDLSNLPPMLIQSGDSEVLRDEITLLAHKATLAGVNVTHELYEDMVHVFQMFTFLPAAKTAISSMGRWVRITLPKIEDEMGSSAERGRIPDFGGKMDVGDPIVVGRHGEEVTVPNGDPDAVPEDGDGTKEPIWRQTPTPTKGSLQLELGGEGGGGGGDEKPSIDIDSLSAASSSSSSSGSPTPTRSRSPAQPLVPVSSDPFLSSSSSSSLRSPPTPSVPVPVPTPATAPPRLRRALTALGTTPSSPPYSYSPPQQSIPRRRRKTQGAASLHVSPDVAADSNPNPNSNPVSPTPSIRRRLRSPTITVQPHPTTRMRSHSHTDIFDLVEGYVGGGAANETVVYAPGGEVRSVGVLGEEGDEGE